MGESILEIRHLGKAFGSHQVLRDIDFTVQKGDVDLHHRGLRLRQVHPAAVHRSAGDAQQRPESSTTAGMWPGGG